MGRRFVRRPLLLLLLLSVSLLGCSGELWESLKEVNGLRTSLNEEFGVQAGIEISWSNGRQTLNLTFPNADKIAKNDDVAAGAEEIARFVAQNYPQIESVDTINIILEDRIDVGVFNATSSMYYSYSPQTLLQEAE